MFDLEGQVAVITGSSRGIGRAIAEAMARAGARVVISSRKRDACEAVAEGIRDTGGEAIVVPCNISAKDALENLIAETVKTFGGLDCVVCNAASNPIYGPMREASDEGFDKIMENNVRSNFWLCNMAAPHIAARGGGSLILISSVAGFKGSANLGIYAISKAADFQLARNLAVEWGSANIRANCIAPGLVRTDFARALWQDPRAEAYVNEKTPLGRIGEPDDIAGIAVFLASRAGNFITGQIIVADGGVTISEKL